MDTEQAHREIEKIVGDYIRATRAELQARWEAWKLDLCKHEMHEAIGALMARQVSLANQLALSPYAWNGHIAPLVLRSMADTYITLAWIFQDPFERSRRFIHHGLGQEKLLLEHRKDILRKEGKDEKTDPVVKATEAWIDSQQFTFLTEVNIGSWSGLDTRKMAEEAGCLDLYRYSYQPFSAATHSMWHHVSRYNLRQCENPLHRYHWVPHDPDLSSDPDYWYRAAKYVAKTWDLFDRKTSIKVSTPSSLGVFEAGMSDFAKKERAARTKQASNANASETEPPQPPQSMRQPQ